MKILHTVIIMQMQRLHTATHFTKKFAGFHVIQIRVAHIEAKTKEIESAALSKQPGLSVGAPPTAQAAEAEEMNKLRRYAGLPPR